MCKKIKDEFEIAQSIVSPIVLDLNGDDIATTGLTDVTHFDHDANGFAEQTGWLNNQDAILVRDLDGNGSIDSGRELFGSETLLANGQQAANGYDALAELDTNYDGQIDAQDAAFADLRLWKDGNGDGQSSADELLTLADAGVQSLATGYANVNQTDANGNTVKQTGTFTKTDGSTGASADIWFATDKTYTVATEWLPETEAIAALPDLQGFGNVYTLHQAMLRDSSGHLQDLVQQFANATDPAARRALIDQLIYAWVGVENIAPDSRGFIADARQLYVLEAFMGEGYIQGYGYNAGTPNTGWNAGAYLTGIYGELAASLYSQLLAQTHFKPLIDSIALTWNGATSQFDWDVSGTVAALQGLYDADLVNAWLNFDEFANTLKLSGDSGVQVLNALRAQGDTGAGGFAGLLGRMGSDSLVGDDGDNVLTGTEAGEALFGNGGNDTLDGGAGDDYLQGGTGNDVYLFNLGSGQDGIFDMDDTVGNIDTVRFGAGINAADITVSRNDYDVILAIAGTDDRLTLQNWGGGDIYRIERFEFADGTVWNAANVQAMASGIPMPGTEGDDVMLAWAGANAHLQGLGGNDSMFGFDGHDTLDGGAGNDYLRGYDGNDSLVGAEGDDTLHGEGGDDTMVGGAGNDFYIVDDAGDVIVEAADEGDDFVRSSISYTLGDNVERLQLDGTANIDATGNALDNGLWGNSGNNVLSGGLGNDYLSGEAGNDLLLGGDGNDNLVGGAGRDTMIGGAGSDHYSVDHVGDLVIEAPDEGDDVVVSTISYTLGDNLEHLQLDGSAAIDATGNALDNGLFGNSGNNVLTGGLGDDYLEGKAGDDTYVFNRGDGQDTIANTDVSTAIDTLRFGAGITDDDVLAFQTGNHLYFKVKGTSDQVFIIDYYAPDTVNGGEVSDHKIDRVEFDNGVVWDQTMIQSVVDRANFNQAPTVNTTLPALEASAGYLFTYTVPVDTIVDPDAWDSVTYSVTMPDGSAVPAWLSFDAATRTLSGNPEVASIGSLQFLLWGTDNYGYSTGQYVTLNVVPDHAPVLVDPLADQAVTDSAFTFALPSTAFTDVESGSALSYSATMADGSPLPDWLSFDPSTLAFSGTPISAGTFSVRVTATDEGNLSASDVFNIVVTAPNRTITGTAGDDTLSGGLGHDTLDGLAGNDEIVGNGGDDTIDGGLGADSMRGGLGNDTYVVDNAADVVTENPGEGWDTVQSSLTWTLGANLENLTLTGTASINATGNELANVITGNQAANVLDGGAGNDTLQGGGGNDTYLFGRGAGQDVVIDHDTTAGNLDKVLIAADLLPSDVTVARDQSHLSLSIDNPDGTTDRLTLTNWFSGDADKVEQIVFANGTVWGVQAINTMLNIATEGADLLEGSSANDELNGLGGNDTLRGHAGDDTLDGGTGNDYLYGGEGNDVYVFGRGYGNDIVSDYDTASGNLDKIRMSADTLTSDVTVSKSGSNLYLSVRNPDGSTNTLTLQNWFSGDAYKVEQVVFADGTIWDVPWLNQLANVATEGPDVYYGTSGNDSFNALGGNDYLYGYGGNDSLVGGDGSDTIYGGDGDDTLAGGAGLFDYLYGGTGNDTYFYTRGDWQDHIFENDATPGNIDTVQINAASTGVSVVRSGNDLAFNINAFLSSDWLIVTNWFLGDAYKIEQVRFTDGVTYDVAKLAQLANTPSYAHDELYGTSGNDYIDGLDGDDLIYGLGGDDTLLGGAWGSDTLYGGDGNDSLIGGNQYDRLDGGNGNDTLDGGSEVDTMTGGMGDDVYMVDDDRDIVIEYINQGTDTVQSSITYGLGANVENLTLIGTTAINGTGNALNNVLTGNSAKNILIGNAGNDTLDGGAGVDTLKGGAGDDIYVVDSSRDVVVENADEGVDTVQSSVSLTLVANVENLTLTGTAKINGTGNMLDNILIGNNATNTLAGGAGNDTLDGMGGVDKLIGGAGDDVYFVDVAGETITERTNEGIDTVNSAVTWTLGRNLENLTLLGSNAINGIGNALNNVLTGNSADNTLTGNAGNDTLDGGAGNDSLAGGSGNDTYLFGRGYGADTVTENDATAGNTDLAQFAAGIATDQLWFRHVGNSLEVSIIGTSDQMTIANWYSGNAYHVEQFKTADNKLLLDSRVENLVQAMAAFSPPSAGETSLPPAYQTALEPVLAANWQ